MRLFIVRTSPGNIMIAQSREDLKYRWLTVSGDTYSANIEVALRTWAAVGATVTEVKVPLIDALYGG